MYFMVINFDIYFRQSNVRQSMHLIMMHLSHHFRPLQVARSASGTVEPVELARSGVSGGRPVAAIPAAGPGLWNGLAGWLAAGVSGRVEGGAWRVEGGRYSATRWSVQRDLANSVVL